MVRFLECDMDRHHLHLVDSWELVERMPQPLRLDIKRINRCIPIRNNHERIPESM